VGDILNGQRSGQLRDGPSGGRVGCNLRKCVKAGDAPVVAGKLIDFWLDTMPSNFPPVTLVILLYADNTIFWFNHFFITRSYVQQKI
jgi:hypothetical protein